MEHHDLHQNTNYSALDTYENDINRSFYYLVFIGIVLVVGAQLALLLYICYILTQRRNRKSMRLVLGTMEHTTNPMEEKEDVSM